MSNKVDLVGVDDRVDDADDENEGVGDENKVDLVGVDDRVDDDGVDNEGVDDAGVGNEGVDDGGGISPPRCPLLLTLLDFFGIYII